MDAVWDCLQDLHIKGFDRKHLEHVIGDTHVRLYSSMLTNQHCKGFIKFVICSDPKRQRVDRLDGYYETVINQHPLEAHFNRIMGRVATGRWTYNYQGQLVSKVNSEFIHGKTALTIELEYLCSGEILSCIHPDWIYDQVYYDFATRAIIKPDITPQVIRIRDITILEKITNAMKTFGVLEKIIFDPYSRG